MSEKNKFHRRYRFVNTKTGRFHDGWGFRSGGANDFPVNGFFSYASESSLQREMECPKRRNVAIFATGYRENSKYLQNQSQASRDSLLGGHLPSRSTSGFEGELG
ncbi:hypothetical protein HAX54_038692 [Datura stramonium]|uniref:Uncharacterized protein n=1 Tax=Datura stramonium TaxID=4076 RepID=A0ABS8RPH0_DATST|nr:hypothetical protein [Datura stramonium]